jgi:hypothetical protein
VVVAQRAGQRQLAERPLVLHEERVVAHPEIVLLVVDELGELFGKPLFVR